MTVLLDTHLLLWALGSPGRLSRAARRQIDDSEVVVSAASVWEVSIKVGLGKLDADPTALIAGAVDAGFRWIAITAEHAAAVGALGNHHRDPFDRLLIAQAQCEGLTLLTNDAALVDYGDVVRLV